MAPRKEPTRLEAVALKILVKYYTDSVLYHLTNCSREQFAECIALIKAELNASVPSLVFNEFATMFLERISNHPGYKRWLQNFSEYLVELIINDKLTKLDGWPRISNHLRIMLYINMHRFKYLTHLHIRCGTTTLPSKLRECDLSHLTMFVCHHVCTDEVLTIISEQCPNLTTLDVTGSSSITGTGIRSLKRCLQLRKVNFENCCIPTRVLINHLLVNNKIEKHEHYVYDLYNIMEFTSGVYYNLTSLFTADVSISNNVLNVIVTHLPNLNCLFFHKNEITGDLCVLRSLSNLHTLGIFCHHGFSMTQVMTLLTEVGDRYLNFTIMIPVNKLHEIVNTVYDCCKNIEFFRITVWEGQGYHEITIPSFEKLKIFNIEIFHFWTININLHFTKLLALEKLHLHMCSTDLVSIVQDHENFPHICEIQESRNSNRRKELLTIIKENNLDINYIQD